MPVGTKLHPHFDDDPGGNRYQANRADLGHDLGTKHARIERRAHQQHVLPSLDKQKSNDMP